VKRALVIRVADETPEGMPLGLRVPPRGSAVSDIARQLLGQLLSGRLAPGTRLPSERQLAQAMGVGRSAVREALKALDVLGILDVRTGDGTYLKRTSSDLLPDAIQWGLMLGQPRTRDLIEARRHIEALTARLAAERATAEQRAELAERMDAMRSAGSVPEFVEADLAFHLTLADAAGNSVLAGVLASARALLRVWIRQAVEQAGETTSTCAEHQRVLDAVLADDPDGAAEAMAAHMAAASTRLVSSLDLGDDHLVAPTTP
jgi:GntR family transcriptional regulator, transcriptional repressor for pyruvate dehydrogenase complex